MKRRVAIVSMVVGATLAACSSSGEQLADPATSNDEATTTTTTSTGGGDVFTEADDLGPVPPRVPDDASVSDSVLEPIEPVPDTGVPGIDSNDVFCRSWSEFAGSYQALTFAWAVQAPEAAARLEVVATDVLSSAVERMADELPAELDGQREALTVDLPTPLLRRAELARELLTESGLDDAGIELVGQLWLDAVTEAGLESETLAVPIADAEFDAAVTEAAQALLEVLPPIIEDPSLIVDVDLTEIEAYLFDNCPDRGVLTGNDNVDR